MRRWPIFAGFGLLASLGCHREPVMVPLIERTIYVTDRFYDVQALSPDHTFVVGYAGKILETTDGGNSWQRRESGTENALYSVHFSDPQHAWIVGQEGLILHTTDGGKTWMRQESNAFIEDKDTGRQSLYLFSVFALDNEHAWAVGDRSILTSTADGGQTWTARKIPMDPDPSGESIAAADPIFYDVVFTDRDHGWVVGEFGKIMYTADGGVTWVEQEKTLLDNSGIFDLLDIPTLYGLHMKNAEEGVASGLEARLARTTDSGKHWAYDPVESDVPLVDPRISVVELSDGSAWAVGAGGQVVRREAGKASWERAKIGQDVLTWLRGISFFDAKHGWLVGGYGLIFRTTDGGKTWLPVQG